MVADEGALLLCEHGSAVVDDGVARRLLPLLDGRDVAALAAAVATEVGSDEVETALDRLHGAGLIGTGASDDDHRAAGYWESAGLTATDAEHGARRAVQVHVHGDVNAEWAEESVRAAGLHITKTGDAALDLVLTDDYLRPALADLAVQLRAAGTSWLLAKPVGVRLAVGPVFEPTGACYHCLAVRMRGHRPAEQFLSGRGHPRSWPTPPTVDVSATRMLGAGLVATAAVNWLAGIRTSPPSITLLDAVTLASSRHLLSRRPQCPVCGDPQQVARSMSAPVRPATRPAAAHRDGGHRARSPEQMLTTNGHLVDQLTGVVAELVPVATDLPFIDVYSSGPNRAMPIRSLGDLRGGQRFQSCGKGTTEAQARASALGEALERASGVFQGDEPRIRASYAELGDQAVHPNAHQLFSDRQLAQRLHEAHPAYRTQVAELLDPDIELEWTPIWSLTAGRHRYLPTSVLFYGYPQQGTPHLWADSNGNAAGTSLEDAMLQGCYELVERDAVGIWWYNQLRCPGVVLEDPADPWVRRVGEGHASLGRQMWALDVSADLGIPTVVALSRRTDKVAEDIVFGFGAHPDGRVALRRAISELNQILPAVARVRPDGSGYAVSDANRLQWWQTARLADQAYLMPDPHRPATRFEARDPAPQVYLGQEWARAQASLEREGLEVLAIDMTRPDIGVPVVKVIIPGMRHFWPRFAPGRLFDVPVRIGASGRVLDEHELNPIPLFA